MANALYAKGRAAFLNADIDWTDDDIRLALVTSSYTVNLGVHQYLSDVGATVVSNSWPLSSKVSAGGVAGAAPAVFTAVTGATGTYAVVYKDTGTAATSPLIAYLDTVTNLPVTPNGGDIKLTFASSTVFTL